jgi:hypothetical protein
MKRISFYKLLFSGLLSVILFASMAITPFAISAQSNPDPTKDLKQSELNKLNPLYIGASEDITKSNNASPFFVLFQTPGGVISKALQFAFPAAGLILFVMIIWGGFEMVAGSASSKSKDAGKQRITAAVIGFLLLFASYWIMQIVQVVFGVSIL